MYPSSGMYHRPSPGVPQMPPPYNSSGRRVPVHRPMSGGSSVAMRNLNLLRKP